MTKLHLKQLTLYKIFIIALPIFSAIFVSWMLFFPLGSRLFLNFYFPDELLRNMVKERMFQSSIELRKTGLDVPIQTMPFAENPEVVVDPISNQCSKNCNMVFEIDREARIFWRETVLIDNGFRLTGKFFMTKMIDGEIAHKEIASPDKRATARCEIIYEYWDFLWLFDLPIVSKLCHDGKDTDQGNVGGFLYASIFFDRTRVPFINLRTFSSSAYLEEIFRIYWYELDRTG